MKVNLINFKYNIAGLFVLFNFLFIFKNLVFMQLPPK